MATDLLSTISKTAIPTSIFPDRSLDEILNDENSQYVATITITGNNGKEYLIKGLMTDPPELEVDAEWEASDFLSHITENFPLLDTIYKYSTMFAGAGGVANPSNLGVSSKKIYKKSGYLEFNLKMRCVDWKGGGIPVTAALILMNTCLPKKIMETSLGQTGETLTNKILNLIPHITEDDARKINDSLSKDITKIGGYLKDVIEGLTNKTLADAAGNFSQEFLNDPQFLVTAASPTPVKIRLGRYFYHKDMLVESVKTTFSKQMTAYGPMFADFDVKLSSRKALLIGEGEPGLGLVVGQKSGGRVTVLR